MNGIIQIQDPPAWASGIALVLLASPPLVKVFVSRANRAKLRNDQSASSQPSQSSPPVLTLWLTLLDLLVVSLATGQLWVLSASTAPLTTGSAAQVALAAALLLVGSLRSAFWGNR